MRTLVLAWLFAGACAVQTGQKHFVKSSSSVWRRSPLGDLPLDPWQRDWKNLRMKMKCLTADSATNEHLIPVAGAPGIMCENPAANQKWVGNKEKLVFFLQWLKRQDPDTLVVALDRDVTYGGCDLDQMVKDFLRITTMAKKKVVAGAEFGLFPMTDQHTRDEYEKLNWQLHAGHSAFGTHADNFTKFGHCPPVPGYAPCSNPPQYKYANSGFYMGQARDLYDALVAVAMIHNDGDQASLTLEYLKGSNSSVTLDFTGSLILDMYGLNADDGLGWTDGVFYNAVTTQQMCFGHWNGKSRPFMQVYLAMLNKANSSRGCPKCWQQNHCPQDALCLGSPVHQGL